MTSPSLPISRIVSVSVTLTQAGAQAQNLSNLLLLGSSNVIDPVERFRIYNTLSAIASDFGTSAPEYLGATEWFAQAPQPTALLVGRWVNAASQGGLRCGVLSAAQQLLSVWNAITTGAFAVQLNGGAAIQVTGLNFSGAANLNAVAALINANAGLTATALVVWNANFQRFEFQSVLTGATSAISFLTSPGSGTDISALLKGTQALGAYVYAGQALETAVTAVTLFDNMVGQQWYGVSVIGAAPADVLAIAAYVDGASTKHTQWNTTQDANVLVATATTDIAYQLQQVGYLRTFTQFSSSNIYAAVSAAARILTVNYTGSNTAMTLKFKQEPGVAPETLNATQIAALEGKNCNVFVAYNNNTSILEQGVMANGTFTDIVTGTDWLSVTIQAAVYNLLYTSPTKIPQTDAGMQLLTTACESVCVQGVLNGLLAPGVWNSAGFGALNQGDLLIKGFYVYAASVNTQAQNLRASRLAMPIQIAAKLAGAVHSANIAITVNQ